MNVFQYYAIRILAPLFPCSLSFLAFGNENTITVISVNQNIELI
jgi:hypothetical protein